MSKGRVLVVAGIVAAAALLVSLAHTDSGHANDEHDISIQKVTGNLKVKGGQTKGYSLHLFNGGPVTETIPYVIVLATLSGCPRPGIDTQADGNLDGADDSFDFFGASIAVATSIPTPSGVPSGNDFQVIYGKCPPTITPTEVDYNMVLDACHSGDAAPLGFFGLVDCPTVQASDGGVDSNSGNDGVVELSVNDKTR